MVWFNCAVELERAGRTEEPVSVLRDATARFAADGPLGEFRRTAERRVAAR